MTIEKIRAAYETRPFKPFTIHLADGRALTVRHPEIMAILPGGRTIFVATDDGGWQVVDLLLVVSIGYSGSGQSKPRRRKSA